MKIGKKKKRSNQKIQNNIIKRNIDAEKSHLYNRSVGFEIKVETKYLNQRLLQKRENRTAFDKFDFTIQLRTLEIYLYGRAGSKSRQIWFHPTKYKENILNTQRVEELVRGSKF